MEKNSLKASRWGFNIMWMLMALYFVGCSDSDDSEDGAYDSSKPVVITDFTPKSGGYGSNLIVYGDNFGNDTTRVKVTVGGQVANLINVKNQSLYCVIPEKAYDGDIEVCILDEDGNEIAYAVAEDIFDYEKQWLVTTPIGTRYETTNEEVEKEGPFSDCGCFNSITWFSFDPQSDFDHLYMTTHDSPPNRFIDFENETVTYFTTSHLSRPYVINWTVDDEQDMVISDDKTSAGTVNWRYTRESGFTEYISLVSGTSFQSLTGAVIHPVNGELYFCLYYSEQIYRYDFETEELTTPLKHLRSKETIHMVVHPTGKYMYLLQYYYSGGGRFIMRSDYDDSAKSFTTPYIICGSDSEYGYLDGVGTNARLSRPAQGVFVKNEDYEGDSDEYDFYFCDSNNHCVRVLTPTGRVYTYAGRGNNGTSGYADGALTTEARFDTPTAIAYDEKRNCFYVGDSGNKVIRKIAEEE